MPILQFNTEFAGQTGILPRLARMVTNDSLAEITSPGYINSNYSSGNPPLSSGDFLFTTYLNGSGEVASQMLAVTKSGNEIIVEPSIFINEIVQGGNAFDAPITIGSLDNYSLNFITDNNVVFSISNSGTLNIPGLSASQALLTDAFKNLVSYPYTDANTPNSLVARDNSGDFSANELLLNGLVLNGTGGTTSLLPSLSPIASYSLRFPAAQGAANTYLYNDGSGNLEWITPAGSGDILQGGNSFGTAIMIGSLDNFGMNLMTNGVTHLSIANTGEIMLPSITASRVLATDVSQNITPVNYTNINTANSLVYRDGSGNFSAGTITATLSGNATNATNVSITNDNSTNLNHPVMFSPLNSGFQAPRVSSFYFTFNPSTGTALIRDIQASFSMRAQFMSTGIVHSNASGNLSSSLIVNADIDAAAAIADTKLATISTAGKISNSATTATNLNTANAIVARDASGNFAAGNAALGSLNVTGTTNLTAIAANRVVSTNGTQDLVGLTFATAATNNALAQRSASGTLNASGYLFGGQALPFDAQTSLQGPNNVARQAKCYAWNTYSDENLKENIVDMDGPISLAQLLAIRTVNFDWVSGQGDNVDGSTPQTQIGYLADDVYAEVPSVVCLDDSNNPIALDYSKLSVLHAAAIKQLNTLISALTVQVNAINTFLGL